MFYEKNMRPMVGFLAIVSMLLSIWAMTSMLPARVGSSTFDVSGGTTLGTCKEPCDDQDSNEVLECLHLSGSTCEPNACMVNTIRTLKCEVCDPNNADANDCTYHSDPNQWSRWELWRSEPCDSNTPYTLDLGDCGLMRIQNDPNDPNALGPTTSSGTTPCVIDTCETGTAIFNEATVQGRLLCGEN